MNKEEKIQEFQKIIDQAKHIVFFTGAGVSTLSGIPDFRSQDGLYNQKYAYPPEEIISHHYFEENPEEFFRFYKDKMLHLDAKPNIVHTFIAECEKKGLSFKEVIDTVEAYIEEQHTYFLLETLDILKKNGRLKGLKAVVATALNIKPVMGSTPDGNIQQLANTRGMKKGLVRMVEQIVADLKNPEEKILAISHCNCRERAETVKNMLLEKAGFKDIIIVDTAGISSMYANDGGIIVVV